MDSVVSVDVGGDDETTVLGKQRRFDDGEGVVELNRLVFGVVELSRSCSYARFNAMHEAIVVVTFDDDDEKSFETA